MPNDIEQKLQTIQGWISKTAAGPAGGPGSEAYALNIRAQKLALAAGAAVIDVNTAECRQALTTLNRALKAIKDADTKIGQIAAAINIIAKALDAAEKVLKMAGAI
jgi:uncharacterized protein with ACT and thioredoxin-like domain